MSLNTGKLRHVVNIQKNTPAQDSVTGAMTDSWATEYSNIWCSIVPVSARDFIESGKHQSQITCRIQIPYISGLDAGYRIVGVCDCHAGKIYNPEGWLEDNETGQEWLTAPCSQGTNSG